MLYIIGGTSRAGKSTISRRLLNSANIPYLSLDWMVMGFTNGMPEIGIHDKLFPDEIARLMWSFTKAAIENIIWGGQDFAIEGEAILPEHARELMDKYPGKVKVCFVGYTDIEIVKKVNEIKTFSGGPGDWLSNESDEYIAEHIGNMVKYSLFVKEQCEIYKVKYFDTSYDFTGALDAAVSFLSAS